MNATLQAFVGRGLQSPNKIAIVTKATLKAWSLEPQSQLIISRRRNRITVWVYQREPNAITQPGDVLPADFNQAIFLSKRSRDSLKITEPSDVKISVPRSLRVKVVPALIDDLPSGDEAQVSDEIRQQVCGKNGWTLIVCEGCSFPVRLHSRKMLSANIRLSLLTRALICSAGTPQDPAEVQLTPLFDDHSAMDESTTTLRRAFQKFRRIVRWLVRYTNRGFESLLRLLLGAPVVTLRTSGALVGDDNEQVVRLNSGVFPLLGIKPGEHVCISWANRFAMAVALEAGKMTPEEVEAIKQLKRVDLFGDTTESPALDHLTIGVSAKLRFDLGIPRSTVLCVRRRLMTAFLGQLNQLTIPVLGLVLAAVAVPNVTFKAIALWFIPVLILGMLPLRHHKPPRGRF